MIFAACCEGFKEGKSLLNLQFQIISHLKCPCNKLASIMFLKAEAVFRCHSFDPVKIFIPLHFYNSVWILLLPWTEIILTFLKDLKHWDFILKFVVLSSCETKFYNLILSDLSRFSSQFSELFEHKVVCLDLTL